MHDVVLLIGNLGQHGFHKTCNRGWLVPHKPSYRYTLAALAANRAVDPLQHHAWVELGFADRRCGERLAATALSGSAAAPPGGRGIVVEPRRWVIEQNFGCSVTAVGGSMTR
jgi:hypothetical protein